jgi:Ca2+-transporting ATPase
MMIIYMPALNKIFKTQALSLKELALTLAVSSIVFMAVELEKYIRYKKNSRIQS